MMKLLKRVIKRLLTEIFTFCHLVKSPWLRGRNVRINGYCQLGNTHVGDECHFNGLQVYGNGRVTIGNNFHSATGIKILTSIHNYQGSELPYDQKIIHKDVAIGDYVWIGMDVTILGGVTIGDGAIIQASSVVSSDIEALGIAGGNPAKIFKYRDKEHFLKLASKNTL